MTTARKLRTAAAATALLAGTVVAGVGSAAPASAASGCPGGYTTSTSYNLYDGAGSLAAIGSVYGYPNSVCTTLTAQGRYYGMYKWMSDGITAVPGFGNASIWDNNYYRYYAGPIQASDVYGPICKDFHFGMKDSSGAWVFNTVRTFGCD